MDPLLLNPASAEPSPALRTRSHRAPTLDNAAQWFSDVSDKITNKLTLNRNKRTIKQLFDTINIYLNNLNPTTNDSNIAVQGTSIFSPNLINNENISPNQTVTYLDVPVHLSRKSSTDNTILNTLTINTSSVVATRRNSTDNTTDNDSSANNVLNSIKGGMNDLFSSIKALNSTRHASRRNSNDLPATLQRRKSIATVQEHSTELAVDTSMLKDSDLKDYYSADVKEQTPNIQVDAQVLISPSNSIGNVSPNGAIRVVNSISSELESIVNIMYGDLETKQVDKDMAIECCAELLNENDILLQLLHNIEYLEFESRKNCCKIVEYCMNEYTEKTVQYIVFRSEILHKLVEIYDYHPNVAVQSNVLSTRSDSAISNSEARTNGSAVATPILTSMNTPTLSSVPTQSLPATSLNKSDTQLILCCDLILRSLLSHRDITAKFLNSEPSLVLPYFIYSQLAVFELASHAFDTLKLILLQHSDLGCYYIVHHYNEFVEQLNTLIQLHDNYYIKYQACKLLYELLQQSSEIKQLYCSDPNNLRITMINLKGNKQIQKQVYYILHIFICMPDKNSNIERIINNNRDNFIKFLEQFESDTDDNELIQSKVQMLEALNIQNTVDITQNQ